MLPTQQDGNDLSAKQLRDQLAMRYGREPLNPLSLCDCCDHDFSLQHALDCKKGELVKKGNNNLGDVCARVSEMALRDVKVEPIVKEASGGVKEELSADFSVRGVWEGG